MRKLFLLSPAKITGARAGFLLNPRATFALARQLHSGGIGLGEAFAFTSGLYFRGKLAYARHFAGTGGPDLVRVITSNQGLQDPDLHVTPADLAAFGGVDIDPADPRYHAPLRRDAKLLADQLHPQGMAVLLGSIASPKYRDILLDVFGERLFFPQDFIGRGDLSRGGLLLRAARANEELSYLTVQGAIFRGQRPARLKKIAAKKSSSKTKGAAPKKRKSPG